MFAACVAAEGSDEYAAKHVCMNCEWLGHKRVTVRSGQEHSVEDVVWELKKNASVEMAYKESRVGESQSNGMI